MRLRAVKIAKIFGIPIYIHYSLLLILPYFVWIFKENVETVAQIMGIEPERFQLHPYVLGFLLVAALFASITLHELGHSWVALRQKIRIHGITLMLFGGVANLTAMPRRFGQEAKIAIAGPLVSFLLAFSGFGLIFFVDQQAAPDFAIGLMIFLMMNTMLGLFNLIPAFPMDGGRIFRSLLIGKFDYLRATQIATRTGKIFAVIIGVWALVNLNMVLVFIMFFIYLNAGYELKRETAKQKKRSPLRVRDLDIRPLESIPENLSLADLKASFNKQGDLDFVVVNGESIVGTLSRSQLDLLDPADWDFKTAGEVMCKTVLFAELNEKITDVMQRLIEQKLELMIITDSNRFIGMISWRDIFIALKVHKYYVHNFIKASVFR